MKALLLFLMMFIPISEAQSQEHYGGGQEKWISEFYTHYIDLRQKGHPPQEILSDAHFVNRYLSKELIKQLSSLLKGKLFYDPILQTQDEIPTRVEVKYNGYGNPTSVAYELIRYKGNERWDPLILYLNLEESQWKIGIIPTYVHVSSTVEGKILAKRPEEVVAQFYEIYLSYVHEGKAAALLKDPSLRKKYFSRNFNQILTELLARETVPYDPILMWDKSDKFENWPTKMLGFLKIEAIGKKDVVCENYFGFGPKGNSKFQVYLRIRLIIEEHQWKIDNIVATGPNWESLRKRLQIPYSA